MKLIPENHDQAITWISKAWHKLLLTPAQTAEVLANICGCSNWQELSVHITNQAGSNFEPNGFFIITKDVDDKIDGETWGLIRELQGGIMLEAMPFECPEQIQSSLIHSLIDSLFILDLPEIHSRAQADKESILETLRSLHFDKSKDAMEGSDCTDDINEYSPSLENKPIVPEQFFKFSQHQGWNPIIESLNLMYLPFHKSFDCQDMNGEAVPVFIVRKDELDRFGGETIDDTIRAITEIIKEHGAKRAIVFSSSFLGAVDDDGNTVTSLGFLIDNNRGGYMMFHTCKTMKSIDSVFDLNARTDNYIRSLTNEQRFEYPKFILDKDFYTAKLFNRFIPQ